MSLIQSWSLTKFPDIVAYNSYFNNYSDLYFKNVHISEIRFPLSIAYYVHVRQLRTTYMSVNCVECGVFPFVTYW